MYISIPFPYLTSFLSSLIEFDSGRVKIDGCFFHLKQSLGRNLKKFDDKLEKYLSDWEFQVQFKCFSALALLPPDQVLRMHQLMMEKLITYPELRAYNETYFMPTWIKDSANTRNNYKPRYDIHEWNVHARYFILVLIAPNIRSRTWSRIAVHTEFCTWFHISARTWSRIVVHTEFRTWFHISARTWSRIVVHTEFRTWFHIAARTWSRIAVHTEFRTWFHIESHTWSHIAVHTDFRTWFHIESHTWSHVAVHTEFRTWFHIEHNV